MFADLSGFTATSRLMDPEDLKDTVNECFEIIERIVLHYGGTIDKYIGDAVMARFGAPSALEHAPQNAINAAIAIRSGVDTFSERGHLPMRLGVHVGINTGLVAAGAVGGEDRRDYTVMGEAVNLASRLQNAATDGQILVGEATYQAARREFQFRQHALKLKGYDRPVAAYEVLATEEHRYRTRPQDSVTGGRSPLVGRIAELAAVARSLEALRAGNGSIVAIVGENGMGKSRLLAEAMTLPVARELEIVEGRCSAVGAGLAFHPFVDLIKTWTGASESDDSRVAFDLFVSRSKSLSLHDRSEVIGTAARLLGVANEEESEGRLADVEGEALERIIHLAVAELLRAMAAERALLVVIEDLHWADQASLHLLESLFALTRTSQISFLLLTRPKYAETAERTLAFIDLDYADRRSTLRLAPLTTAATSELVANLTGSNDVPASVQALIAQRTEGNPFYVEEVLRSLREKGGSLGGVAAELELPATIEEVILSRVDRVEPAAKRILQIAAVVGRRFPRDLVAELAGEESDVDVAFASLVARELVEPVTSRRTAIARVVRMATSAEYVFKHALIQEAVYGSILKKTRRELHAECARSIERRFEDHLHDAYGMLAYHYLRADALEKAEEYTLAAGELAARTAASHEALGYFREAYRLYRVIHFDKDDKPKRALLEKNIAQALFNTGNLGESIEHFDAALALHGIRLLRSTFSRWLKFGVDLGGLLARLYAGKHRAGKRGTLDDHAILEILYNRARAENPTDPERYVFDTIAASRYVQKVDPHMCAQACEITATTGAFFAFGGLSINVARRFLDEASHLVREPGGADEFSVRAMGTVVEFHAGDWSDRYDIGNELMEAGLRAGKLWAADTYLGMAAERRYRQGRFDEAAADIARLRKLRLDYGYEFSASAEAAQTAFSLLERGDLVEAERHMRAYYEMRREDGLHVLALSGLAKIESLAGRQEGAAELLSRAETIISHAGRLAPFYLGAYWTSRLLLDVLRLETKRERATETAFKRSARRAVAMSHAIARERPEALRLSARGAAVSGDRARSLDLYGRALDAAEALDALPEVSRVCAGVAQLLERNGGAETFRGRSVADWRARADEVATKVGLIRSDRLVATTVSAASAANDVPSVSAIRTNGK